MKKQLRVSVRALVEHVLRRGDLNSTFTLGDRHSGTAGIRAHQRILQSRPDSWLAEVPVAGRVEGETAGLMVHGRIDGVGRERGVVVIEEIKTTGRDLDAFIEESESLHWGQVRTYAALYAEEHDLETVTGRLTCLQIESGRRRTFDREFTRAELAVFFSDLAARFLGWAERLEAWRDRRNRSIAGGGFPFDSMREGQRRMAVDVYNAIKGDGQALIQAPTGTGKTVAALFPAVKALGEGLTTKIFYLTARTTGRVIAENTLAGMADAGMRVKRVTLTAKDKICFNPDKACTGEDCDFARGYYDRLNEARARFFTDDAFTRPRILELAREHNLCPFEFSLDLTLWADCVICDVNYAFAPGVFLKRFFAEVTEPYSFLIDEAHNLVDRAREMFSARLRKSTFLKVRRMVKDGKSELYRAAGTVNARMLEIKRRLESEEKQFSWEEERPERLLPTLRKFSTAFEHWHKRNAGSPPARALLDFYFEVGAFLRTAEGFDDRYAAGYELEGRDLLLHLYCMDPAGRMADALTRARAAIFFSATMSPMEYFSRLLGCREDSQQRVLPSPFPQENLCVMTDASVSTTFRNRPKTLDALIRSIGAMTAARPGNYLVFFPSYKYLGWALPRYRNAFPKHTILVQEPGMSESAREDFLAGFTRENRRTLVGFVVMGGIFGEGIDLAGDRLSGAAVVGLGLPGITPERELIRRYHDDRGEGGFAYAYVFPGINRVLQAAGRVIRSENDLGTVLLIDTRYRRFEIGELLPGEWHVRPVRGCPDIQRELTRFWGTG